MTCVKTLKQNLLILICLSVFSLFSGAEERILYDKDRQRHIPIEVSLPDRPKSCHPESLCPVAFISSGYGVRHSDYSFITKIMNQLGYMVVSVQHEIEGDPALSRTPPYSRTRKENWQRGMATLKFVKQTLALELTNYDFRQLTLIGHSNGGDISALYTKRYEEDVSVLITLEHRREWLPRTQSIRILTIRASDFPADEGVLLAPEELLSFKASQLTIEHARHNDMTDHGPDWLKEDIASIIQGYLSTSLRK